MRTALWVLGAMLVLAPNKTVGQETSSCAAETAAHEDVSSVSPSHVQALGEVLSTHAVTGDSSFWQPLGAPRRSRMTSIAKTSGDVLFATGEGGSLVYRSDDLGRSWQRVEIDGPRALVRVPPDTGNTVVFVGREGFNISSDGGQSWDLRAVSFDSLGLPFTDHGVVGGVATAADTVFALVHSEEPCIDFDYWSVIRSDDQGRTWSSAGAGSQFQMQFYADQRGVLFTQTYRETQYSIDGGATWTKMQGPPDAVGVHDFASTSAATFYVATGRGIYRTSDAGETWQRVAPEVPHAHSLELAPDGALFIGGSSVYRLFPGTPAAQKVGSDSPPGAVDFAFDGKDVFAAGRHGPYSYSAQARSWELETGALPVREIRHLARGRGTTLFAADRRRFDYVYVSEDGGRTWSPTAYPRLPFSLRTLYADSTGLVFVQHGITSHRSLDEGATWDKSDTRIYTLVRRSDGSLLGADQDTTYLSTDDGASWQRFGRLASVPGIRTPTAQHLARGSGDTLLVGTSIGMQRSTDDGRTWEVINDGLLFHTPDTSFHPAVVDIAVTPRGTLLAASRGGLYRSDNGGASWNRAVPEGDYEATVLVDDDGTAYYGSRYELYISRDDGSNWDVAARLQNSYVMALALAPDGHLLAGTHSGIYRSRERVATSIDAPDDNRVEEVVLHSPAPNPLRHQTRLRISLRRPETVSLVVYDLVGRRVRVLLAEERMAPGRHAVAMTSDGLASGMYVVRLQAGSVVRAQQLVVVR